MVSVVHYATHTGQGRHGEFDPDKAHNTVVGIICPPLVEIGLTVTQNLGKARALKALVVVAALPDVGSLLLL